MNIQIVDEFYLNFDQLSIIFSALLEIESTNSNFQQKKNYLKNFQLRCFDIFIEGLNFRLSCVANYESISTGENWVIKIRFDITCVELYVYNRNFLDSMNLFLTDLKRQITCVCVFVFVIT